jgi:glycosyltransferase involved in cell wall biosynthesis
LEKIKKLRLLILTQYFWPENFLINDLALYLTKKNIKVDVVTGYPNYPEGKIYKNFFRKKKKFSKLDNVNIYRVPTIPRKESKFFLFLNYLSYCLFSSFFVIFILKKKYDIVFTYQISPITVGLPSVLLRTIKKVPHVMWVQDLWPDTVIDLNIFKSKIIQNLIRLISLKIYQNCDHIITQSRMIEKKLNYYLKKKIPITTVRNWLELNLNLKRSNLKILYPKKKLSNFDIIFAGNIGEAQDIESIVECIKMCQKNNPRVRWIFLGGGSKLDWLKKQKINNKLNNLYILGKKPKEHVMNYLILADATLISLKNGNALNLVLPYKFLHYLFLKKPILGMINGETNYLIKKNKVGFCVNSGNYEMLYQNILKIQKLSTFKLNKIKNNCEKLIKSDFFRERQISKIIKIIRV